MNSPPIDNDRIRTMGVPCSLHMVEVFNEVTSGAFQLLCLLSIGISIKSRIIIFILP